MVVNWEIARPDLAGMDVGQLCAELATVSQLWPERAKVAGEILKHFVRTNYAGDVGSGGGDAESGVGPVWGVECESGSDTEGGVECRWEACTRRGCRDDLD
jgi:hypothetical protein